jgi:hypothetical protein
MPLSPPLGSRSDPYNTGVPWWKQMSSNTPGAAPGVNNNFGQGFGSPQVAPSMNPKLAKVPQPANMTGFGPDQNLIGTQFNPQADPRLQGTQGQVTGLQNQLASGGGQIPGQGQAQDWLNQSAQTISKLPNLQESTQNLYGALTNQANVQSAQQLRDLGQRAASLGRLGSGMVTADAGDIFRQREANLAGIGANLANQSAQAQNAQQFGQGQALAGLSGQQFGMGQGQLGAQQGVLGQLSGLESQQYGQNLGNLGFLQQERGYQQGLDQQALQNRVSQEQLQQQEQGQAFGQQQDQANALAQYGLQDPNPLGNYIAQQYGQQGEGLQQNAGDLLRLLFQNQQGKPARQDAIGSTGTQ